MRIKVNHLDVDSNQSREDLLQDRFSSTWKLKIWTFQSAVNLASDHSELSLAQA